MRCLQLSDSAGRLVWTAALAAILICVLATAALITVQYQMAIREAQATTQNTARLLEEHALRSVDPAHLLLDRIEDWIDPVGLSQVGTSDRDWRIIQRSVDDLMQVSMVGVLNVSGHRVLMTGPSLMPNVDLSHRDYFQAHRAGAALVIGRTIRANATGELSFTISQRLDEPDGRFAGVAVAVIPLSYFAEFYESLDLGPNGTIGIVRDDGAVVIRHPWREEYLESSVASSDLLQIHLPSAASGTYRAPSPFDGVERFISYRKLPGAPLVIFSTVTVSDALAHWWAEALWIGALAMFGIALVVALSAFAVHALRGQEIAQAGLRRALADRELLFAETHHRIKNNLQSVASLLGLMASRADPTTREGLNRAVQRLRPMSLVHEMLYRSGDIRRVDVPSYLQELCSKLAEGYEAEERGISMTVEVTPLSLDIKTATPLGLIVTELVSNAFKHGFPEGRTGTVLVQMEARRLIVSDNGVGMAQHTANGRGFGLPVIRALAEQIGGQVSVEYGDGFTTVVVRLPGAGEPATAPPRRTPRMNETELMDG